MGQQGVELVDVYWGAVVMPNGQPAQLANLRPRPWLPGQSGNPSGRAKGVVYPVEYLRRMAGLTPAELRAIASDEDQPSARIMAARMALQALDSELDAKDQREAFNVVADRTTGKPVQDVRIEATMADRPPAELLAELQRRHAIPAGTVKQLPDATSSTK